MVDVGPFELLRILAACSWPRVTFGRRVIAGEQAWRAVTLTPAERCRLLERLGRRELLVVTAAARRHLRAWLDRQRLEPATPETFRARRDRIARELRFYGDAPLLLVVAAALARAPRCVSDFVISTHYVITAGRTLGGWTSGPLPAEGRPIVLAGHLSDEWVLRNTLHEVGHCWSLDLLDATPTAFALEESKRRSAAEGWTPEIAEILEHGEFLADALASAWGERT